MRTLLQDLIATLRRSGVPVSVAESIDAAAAVAAAGFEREALKEALAATLVKDESDRPLFLDAFERTFPVRLQEGSRRRRRSAAHGAGVPTGGGARGTGTAASDAAGPRSGAGTPESDSTRATAARTRDAQPRWQQTGRDRDARPPSPRSESARLSGSDADELHGQGEDESPRAEGVRLGFSRRERALLAMPLRAMSAREVEEASELVHALARRFTARLRRRLRPRKRGRLDFRRTIRASVPHGGVLAERRYRGRRPRRLSLVALCDLSASVARATDFFLALLAPAAEHFASVRLFGFVDRLVEIEFVNGQVRPAAAMDLMARSDFGRVLVDFMAGVASELTADTLLLVLGDARNNRRPPRADLLAVARSRVRRLLWLNPDQPERWDTGDSVIATYSRHADLVVACGSLAELERALVAVMRL